ncbi:MAG TPA: hypothetical protein VFF79_03010 [Conexibacter sp.]|jgi:hypothetical protein|nr:hypothetical protein [Conexibacter sp.]
MIDEGRRQSDRQFGDLERIRGRAQWLFTVASAVLASLGAAFVHARPGWPLDVAWLVALLLLVYGIGGAAGILAGRAEFTMIDTAVLSSNEPPIQRALAQSYTRMLAVGENTVATRLTVFRQAVLFSLTGGYMGLLAWLL